MKVIVPAAQRSRATDRLLGEQHRGKPARAVVASPRRGRRGGWWIALALCCACAPRAELAPPGSARNEPTPSPPAEAPLGQQAMAKPTSADRLAAGFRFSTYGPDYDPGAQYWADVGQQMAARFPGAIPGALWIVGKLAGEGTELSFPGRSDDPLIRFTAEDGNEETLSLFDRLGFECWLQVEPGNAPVEELIDLVLARYGHHSCVVGFGVDVEWHRSVTKPEGEPVSDALAARWLAAVRAHRQDYRLFLKHWEIAKMPPTLREGILFVDDSQMFPSADAMIEEFAAWGRAFAPAPVAFQFGYPADKHWWGAFDDPAGELGRRILAATPNTQGLYWVDFTVIEVFPPRTERPVDPAR